MKETYCDDSVCIVGEDAVIRIQDLSVKYGARYAIKNINIDLPPCSVTAILGPSGSGKSSLLSCINRMTDLIARCQVSGQILFGGENVLAGRNPIELRRRIGMIFQKPNPLPFSIRKNLTLPLKYHGVRKKAEVAKVMTTALKEVGLWSEVEGRLDEPAHSLSGGQQQRLCIARAIALEPEVLMMDEPCSALDPVSTNRIEQLITRLRQKYTVIVVTHNISQARRIADNTVLLWSEDGVGKVIDQGPTGRVFEKPKTQTAEAYIEGRLG
jgi:phosphate transport system ATP-binding protein